MWYNQELKRIKVISLPRYDDVTDSFVDGPLPNSADSFFKNDEKMKDFFEIKKHVNEGHSKSSSH
jgi:hypothetical protein